MSSLLTPQDAPVPKSLAKNLADTLLAFPRRQLKEELAAWHRSVAQLWRGTSDEFVSEVLMEMGTEAAELFRLSALKATQFEALLPGCTAPTVALIRPFQIHQDGTVTLVEEWPV